MCLYLGVRLTLCQAIVRGIDMSNGLSAEDAHDALTLGGLPSKASVGPEPAKCFDLLILNANVRDRRCSDAPPCGMPYTCH